VLQAMGVLTHGNVRVSLSRESSEQDVQQLLDVLPGVVAQVRGALGAGRL
jgi:cysteine desulfurase